MFCWSLRFCAGNIVYLYISAFYYCYQTCHSISCNFTAFFESRKLLFEFYDSTLSAVIGTWKLVPSSLIALSSQLPHVVDFVLVYCSNWFKYCMQYTIKGSRDRIAAPYWFIGGGIHCVGGPLLYVM